MLCTIFSANITPKVPGGSNGKESACNAGDPTLIHGLGRSPGEGNGNPLQYSCLENPMADHCLWGHKESENSEELILSLLSSI